MGLNGIGAIKHAGYAALSVEGRASRGDIFAEQCYPEGVCQLQSQCQSGCTAANNQDIMFELL
jgi:hypothetical protein